MDGTTPALMAVGAGSAIGLRPYMTVFLLSIAGMAIPAGAPEIIGHAASQIPDTLANPWVAVISGVLAVAEFGIDKIFGVNLPIEMINQILRPILGAIIGFQMGSDSGGELAVLTTVLGIVSATPVSLGKGGITAGLTAIFPEPVSQAVRSLLEDVGAVVLAVSAVLLPILAALFGLAAIAVGVVLFLVFRKALLAIRAKYAAYTRRRAGKKAPRTASVA